ncbi:MAG: alpha,alpha-phosphotrehalase [Erysipelotrichaceae bacterium]|nr:alpha,alpha-phosphotrehalase [Erysipelotrichaceae bacterium]
MSFKDKTVYQVYIKSFCDSDGDGIGDLNGIRQKLPYIKSLGVDYIWITPFCVSPMFDNGYDVADYRAINPMFGTMEDCDNLLKEANEMGLGIMLDMVFNHTSWDHEWFKKALKGDPKYMDYYIFRDPVDGHAPTEWISSFGESAWDYVPELDKWYLHLFDKSQPDLNWENPAVREEMKDIIRFWKEKGVKGFRFDVLNLISKPETFEGTGSGHKYCKDGRRIHEFIRELVVDSGIEDMITVGEMAGTTLEACKKYSNEDSQELKMVFNFHHLKVDYKNNKKWALQAPDFAMMKDLFTMWQEEMQEAHAWNAVFWCCHDQPRVVERFGDINEYWKRSGKMLGTFVHLLRGTPYIFQGEEIGMTNAHYTDISQYRDVECINYYKILMEGGATKEEALEVLAARARDNGRTPMQWDTSDNAGFTTGTPWIGVNSNYKTINTVAENDDPDSILNYYRQLVQLRKDYPIIADGTIKFLETGNDKVIAYKRQYQDQELYVVCSFSKDEEAFSIAGLEDIMKNGKVLIENVSEHSCGKALPFEAVAYIQ